METSSRNIIEVFVKLIQSLECPVCYEYVSSPIWQCEAGHILCNQCIRSIHNCPTCRRSFSPVRVRSLEQISDIMLFPCKNDGCEKILPLADIQHHENTCALANAYGRPDESARSTILQYNILKYIEHDIAPFFITSHQTNENATQTDFEIGVRNVKDASTTIDSDFKSGGTQLSQDKTASVSDPPSFVSASINACTKTDILSEINVAPTAQSDDLDSSSELFKMPGQAGNTLNHSFTTSEKLNKLLCDNNKKLKSKKGSTNYDCYLKSTSRKLDESSTTKSGFDFSPFISQLSFAKTHSQDCEATLRYTFSQNDLTDNDSSSTSNFVRSIPPNECSLESESIFNFKGSAEEVSPAPQTGNRSILNKMKRLLAKHHSSHRAMPSGFDKTANSLTSSASVTSISSCNLPGTSAAENTTMPDSLLLAFGDISFHENLKGKLDSVCNKASSAFEPEKNNYKSTFKPLVTSALPTESLGASSVYSFTNGRSPDCSDSQSSSATQFPAAVTSAYTFPFSKNSDSCSSSSSSSIFSSGIKSLFGSNGNLQCTMDCESNVNESSDNSLGSDAFAVGVGLSLPKSTNGFPVSLPKLTFASSEDSSTSSVLSSQNRCAPVSENSIPGNETKGDMNMIVVNRPSASIKLESPSPLRSEGAHTNMSNRAAQILNSPTLFRPLSTDARNLIFSLLERASFETSEANFLHELSSKFMKNRRIKFVKGKDGKLYRKSFEANPNASSCKTGEAANLATFTLNKRVSNISNRTSRSGPSFSLKKNEVSKEHPNSSNSCALNLTNGELSNSVLKINSNKTNTGPSISDLQINSNNTNSELSNSVLKINSNSNCVNRYPKLLHIRPKISNVGTIKKPVHQKVYPVETVNQPRGKTSPSKVDLNLNSTLPQKLKEYKLSGDSTQKIVSSIQKVDTNNYFQATNLTSQSNVSNDRLGNSINFVKSNSPSEGNKPAISQPFIFENRTLFSFGTGSKDATRPASTTLGQSDPPKSPQLLPVNRVFTFGDIFFNPSCPVSSASTEQSKDEH